MDAEDLRLAVYRAFAETGRAPEPGELGTEARRSPGLTGGHLALGDQGQIVMAHRSRPCRRLSVMGPDAGGAAARDSFAPPAAEEGEVLVATVPASAPARVERSRILPPIRGATTIRTALGCH